MKSVIGRSTRGGALLSRYWRDRRLPPEVSGLVLRRSSAWLRDRLQRAVARLRRPLGAPVSDGAVARLGTRRLHTLGAPDRSEFDAAGWVAAQVCEAIGGAGIPVTAADDGPEAFVLAVDQRHRADAWRSLVTVFDEPGWFVEWHVGRRRRLTPISGRSGWLYRNSSWKWRIFRACASGERVVGYTASADVTFWELGTSGKLEQIGVRGQQRFDPQAPATIAAVGGHTFPSVATFPIGSNLERVSEPVDIVYTWVDGSDPDWIASFQRTTTDHQGRIDEAALDPARFRSRDELRYSLRSVWAFCGWARTIWIVTDGQKPGWLVEDDRIRVVDHRDILPDDALPTFNSHAIEAALHHIDGLAEQFVYFNDDMFIGRPVRPELFFTSNGMPKVFASDARVPGYEDAQTQPVDTAAIRGRELLLDRFGRVATYKLLHSPYPLLRSVMFAMEEEFAEIVGRTQHSRFRSPTDLSTASSFAPYYGLGIARAVLGEVSNEYVHVESGRLKWHLDRIRLGGDIDTYCINETDGGAGRSDREQLIADFFEEMLPVPAPWESDH